ncbi:phytanoyl-CoA dioxygenase family protein [Methylobacillus arboreus]|uniref:phytanoyl-CoA dioxygenase family protein n=1 Tax=Methylobacillus arboreus TaxID=755170 RepID=UPI001E55C529|nr:phytanoyl-CoA dioxygenase family protein [Methylobacillus arboreus]MCB5190014.1 phytanoyl-CoA dioxygenase family protein [Methylobacillus arboreus]
MDSDNNCTLYPAQGYQIFRNVLSHSWLQSTRDAAESVIQHYRENGPFGRENDVSLGELAQSRPQRNPGVDGSKWINEPFIIGDLLTQDGHFVSLLAEQALWSIAARLLATEIGQVIFHYSNLTRKPAGIGPSIVWHRDAENTYFCPNNDRLLRLLIPLQGMSRENGGTAVVPGSHLDTKIDKTTLDEHTVIHPELAAGDVLAIHSQLLHGGAPNRSHRERDVLIMQFGVAGATFRHQEVLELGALHPRGTFMQLLK